MNALLLLFVCFWTQAHAGLKWGFADTSLNYLDWDRGTEAKSPKEDFAYLELQGGGQFDWGELYGFFDFENTARVDQRTAGKGSINYYMGESGLSLYGHVYNFASTGFSEQNRVLGLGWNFERKNFWFKPFWDFTRFLNLLLRQQWIHERLGHGLSVLTATLELYDCGLARV